VPAHLLESPEQDLGAIHALELPFVFGTYDISAPSGERVVEDPEQMAWATELSESMRAAWTNFARTGNPNGDGVPAWPSYDLDRRPTMVWANDAEGAITSRAVDDPDGERRRAWETFTFPPFG
jgi:para-nitrobenzyl esterase